MRAPHQASHALGDAAVTTRACVRLCGEDLRRQARLQQLQTSAVATWVGQGAELAEGDRGDFAAAFQQR